MGKQKAPPAPNYQPIINAQAQAAAQSQQLATQQYQWAQDQYAQNRANTDKVVGSALDQQNALYANSLADRQRYEQTYQPLEDQYIQNAENYSSPGQVEARAGAAAGDVTQQFDVARANAQRQLEAYGVDPTQTRAAALDLGTRTQEAAARASAMNTSRRQDALMGQQMLGTAINQGNQTVARSLQEGSLGLQAGNTAVNEDLATTQSGANTIGTAPQYLGLQTSNLAAQANTTNQAYQNQLSRYQANQQASSGVLGAVGSIVGFGAKSYDSGGTLLGKSGQGLAGVFGFEDGGAVPPRDDAVAALPVRRGVEPAEHPQGIAVDRSLSPSRGLVTDDVPARLNAGEFVLPRDTVEWYGQRYLQGLIKKGAQESAGAQARPSMAALPVERPAVSSGALQVQR